MTEKITLKQRTITTGKNRKQRNLFLGAAILLWLMICMVLTPVYTTVTLTFENDPSGEVITTVYAGPRENVSPSDARSRVVNSGVARISYLDIHYGNHCSLKRIDPVDRFYDGELTVSSITVRQNGIVTMRLTEAEELRACFTGNEQVAFTDETGFTFTVTGEDPQLIPTEAFRNLYSQRNICVLLLGFLIFGTAVALLIGLFLWFEKKIQEYTGAQKIIFTLCLSGLLAAVAMCVYVGLRSPFWLNPDEYDVKAAVLYYFSHFMPPDIRSDVISDSFPVYGTSRHFEFNLFYFYAGKIGQFFSDAAVQIRLFSLILFAVMTGSIIKNSKKHPALLFLLLLTPQVWYIYSYSTSDALDFFVGFLALYELIEENSMLNRLLREKFCRRHILYYAALSLLFVHLFWAKMTFYTILMFLFLILLIRLFYTEKRERSVLLRKYLILAGLTLLIFAVRYLVTDYPYYGFDKVGVIAEVTERQAEYGYRFSTPPMEAAYSMRFFEKGISLGELLTQYEFHKNLFRTFAGFFGSYAFGEANWYYYVMGVLYLLLIVRIIYRFWKYKDGKRWWDFAAVLFSCFVQYVLIVANSWLVDFQPQGRYLLPVLFFIAYLISRIDDVRKDKVLCGILVCTCLLSVFCFWHVGIPNLVPDRVMLP